MALWALRIWRKMSPSGVWFQILRPVMRFQNSRRRSTRRSGGLPAISAELMAPIETPTIQSTSRPFW